MWSVRDGGKKKQAKEIKGDKKRRRSQQS